MTIKELIARLQQHKNQDATVLLVWDTEYTDVDEIDIDEFEDDNAKEIFIIAQTVEIPFPEYES